MSKRETDFRKRLLSTFKIEAQDHLKTMSYGLIELEKTPPPEIQMEIVENIFRTSHSLKGAARAVNMTDIEAICQSLEGVFATWKQTGIKCSAGLFDTVYRAIDAIRTIVSLLGTEQNTLEKTQISKLLKELSHLKTSKPSDSGADLETQEPETSPSTNIPLPAPDTRPLVLSTETVRISATKLETLLLQAEEMLVIKQTSSQYFQNLKDITFMFESLKRESSKAYYDVCITQQTTRWKGGKFKEDFIMAQYNKFREFFIWEQTHIKSMEDKLTDLLKSFTQCKALDKMVDNLLDDVKEAMMLPFSTIMESFPIFVRDIAYAQGKELDLIIRGEGLEIDRRILDEVKDPLIHLIRNCINHGIESPDVRVKNNKPLRGKIAITVSSASGNKIEILISDDGAGINLAKVKEVAVKNGILSHGESDNLNEEETLSLIFHSGVSTSPIITDISGRGLGLAIAREKIEKLGGSISVETKYNSGTTFRILLPLTITTFRGVLVRVTDYVFVIPTAHVERTLRIKNNEIKTVENRATITANNCPVSFVRLDNILELPLQKRKTADSETITVLILSISEKRIAFGVDEILGEQEVLAKGLGKQLSRVRNIVGATILGSGKPVPILNVPDLIRSAVKASVTPVISAVAGEQIETKRKSILVVEDSITSRILLKNILESAGYDVKTAIDGIDAITILKTEDFDLVVSDIEMPRMDGFDLTTKIRGEKRLADMPVILVTALETREDRERGIEVGANAYIVKSSFDQSNLLEIVRRLM